MNRYSLFFLPVCLIAPILMSVIGFTDLLPPGRFVHQGRTSETAQTMISHQRSAPATTAQSVARMSRSRETMLLSYQTRSRMLDAVNAHQIDAQQCYADPQLHTVTT
ncbi:MAG TPA: hypothetical protein VFB12_16395, partial [Ktedonobacteraceae bacterium]|nr:hypothetical protein [Ktedonobacteraceae bacterium]